MKGGRKSIIYIGRKLGEDKSKLSMISGRHHATHYMDEFWYKSPKYLLDVCVDLFYMDCR
jgi:hypothetical protein